MPPAACPLVNAYDLLEHGFGITGLHPHARAAMRALRQRLAERAQALVPAAPDGVIVDLGCGSGAGTLELAEFARVPVVGVDVSADAIARARRRTEGTAPSRVRFFKGSFEAFVAAHPGTPILGVFSSATTMFVPDLPALYRAIARSLTPGGVFLDAPMVLVDDAEGDLAALRDATSAVCGCAMRIETLGRLRGQVEDAGLEVVECASLRFDLMYPSVLLREYAATDLLAVFVRQLLRPDGGLGGVSRTELLARTFEVLRFFGGHRTRLAGGVLEATRSRGDAREGSG